MCALATPLRRRKTRKVLWKVGQSFPQELLAFCPGCKALDVLRFAGGMMIPTRKYVQSGRRIYHDCGTDSPCRLHASVIDTNPYSALMANSTLK